MKKMIIPALAVAGVVAYGAWRYHKLEECLDSAQRTHQALVVDVTSFSDALAQRRIKLQDPVDSHVSFGSDVPFRDSIHLPAPLEDHIATGVALPQQADSMGPRLLRLRTDAGSLQRSLEGYQQELRDTHELLEGYVYENASLEKLPSSINYARNSIKQEKERQREIEFRARVTELYAMTQQKVIAAHKKKNYNSQGPQFHIFYAVDDVLFDALKEHNAEMLYILSLGNPSESSQQTFEKEIERLKALCETINLGPKAWHRICLHSHYMLSGSWSDFLPRFKYVIEDGPNIEATSLPSKDHILIYHEMLPDKRVRVSGIEHLPIKK